MRLLHAAFLLAAFGAMALSGCTQAPAANPLASVKWVAVPVEGAGGVIKEHQPEPQGPASGEAVGPKSEAAPAGGPCPCGCGKVGCECGKAPPAEAVSASAPALEVTVADKGCGPCERWEREVIPALNARGWKRGKNYVIRVVPFGSAVTPSFSWRGVPFSEDGYSGKDDWLRRLKVAMGDQPSAAASDASYAVRVCAGDAKGSGGVISHDGDHYTVLTAAHVVRAGWPHAVLVGETEYPAEVLDHDVGPDLAVVSFDCPADIPVLPVAEETPADGAAAESHGFPGGGKRLDRKTRVRTKVFTDAYAADGGFLKGESGGSVVVNGELVGVVSGTSGRTGIVVPLAAVKAFLAEGRP